MQHIADKPVVLDKEFTTRVPGTALEDM